MSWNLQISTKLISNVIVSKASSIFLLNKNFASIIFYGAKNDKLIKQDDSPFKFLFTVWFAQGPEKYFIKLLNSCSLTKFQVIPKFMAPGPLDPIFFCIKK